VNPHDYLKRRKKKRARGLAATSCAAHLDATRVPERWALWVFERFHIG
jgi:hypothetical protein